MSTVFDSECSSGCESGWTVYLEQSFLNKNDSSYGDKRVYSVGEEDLSMVSDASSGPPHRLDDDDAYFNEEDNNGCFYSTSKAMKKPSKSGTKKQKGKENKHLKDQQQHLPSFLHDTAASSPLFDFSTNNVGNESNLQTYRRSMVDYSQGFSANNFEGRPSFQEEQFGFLQQSSLSENEFQGNKWY